MAGDSPQSGAARLHCLAGDAAPSGIQIDPRLRRPPLWPGDGGQPRSWHAFRSSGFRRQPSCRTPPSTKKHGCGGSAMPARVRRPLRPCGDLIVERLPFHAVEMRHLGTRDVVRGAVRARHIGGEPFIHRTHPRVELGWQERYGPLPTISVTWRNGSVVARRSGMMLGIAVSCPGVGSSAGGELVPSVVDFAANL
jgi:hypothetical protein